MAVTRLDIHAREPYEGGAAFGAVGPYERLDGTIHFAVDPAHPANAAIIDLDRAERGAGGLVHFAADFCLLRPADPARGNRRLLFDVVNRGRRRVPRLFNRAPDPIPPTVRIDPGDGFLMRHGWTVVWCGWQWDVIRGGALMGLAAPPARDDHGRPIEGWVLVEFQPNAPCPDHLLCDRVHQTYDAASLDDPEAALTVRDWLHGPRTVIPRARWRFARDNGGRPVADPTRVWLDGGFDPGRIYAVTYRTRVCPVVGTGLLAVRDCVAFLRFAGITDGNPCAGALERVYGFGVSQSGRFLRHFLYLGLNVDEAGRQVFDGLIPHVAGARRGEFNHRYAQPSQQAAPGFGHLMPFTDDDQTDPLTGRTDGLLRRQRALGGVPRVLYTNTAAEYWRGDASLLHTDLEGTRDVEPPEEVRIYHFAGTQHGPGGLPLSTRNAVDGAHGAHALGTIDYTPLLRAALVNLDRWVSEGVAPPPSAFPRLADGGAVTGHAALTTFRAFPGVVTPDPERLWHVRRVDLGPEAERGIGRYPPVLGAPYPSFVAAVDADGNEMAGIRLPDVAVPVATVTGWNPRHPGIGGAGQILSMLGSTLPFPATAAERARRGDPRPAIDERYRDRADYLARVRAVAEELAAARYVLVEDVELLVRLAAQRYDAFAPAAVP
jgi:hypothetical protein